MSESQPASPARTHILGEIRKALDGQGGAARQPQAALEAALATRLSQVRPSVHADAVAQFRAKAAANLIRLHDLASMDEVPDTVARILAAAQLPPDISVAPALRSLAWPATLELRVGKARLEEKLAVSLAQAAIAETGSLVLCSGETAPSSLTFAPEHHIIVLSADAVTPHLEDGLARVRQSAAPWPRTVNLVSGPSRTADVAGIVVRPAHGPKSVHVLMIAAASRP